MYTHIRRGDTPELLARFRACPLRERVHVALRSRMMNLWRLEAEVPREGTIVDLGCGQGLVALALAASEPGRNVVGIEREARKVEAATRAADGLDNVTFRQGDISEPPSEAHRFDVALLLDVLYLWPPAGKRRIVENVRRSLRPGGLLLVQELARRPAWKYRVATLQERLALHLLRTTTSREIHIVTTEENERLLRSCGFAVEAVPFHRGLPYAHWIFRCRRA